MGCTSEKTCQVQALFLCWLSPRIRLIRLIFAFPNNLNFPSLGHMFMTLPLIYCQPLIGCLTKNNDKWKRRSVGAPSRDVPSLSLFQTKSPSNSHFTSVGQTVYPWESWITDRRTDAQTHTQTGPILYPRPLTREGKMQLDVDVSRTCKWWIPQAIP